jgi:colanic acid/amylovoran biosynthesis glycosyltransferase
LRSLSVNDLHDQFSANRFASTHSSSMTELPGAHGRIGYVVAVFPAPTETFVAREIEALKQRGFEVVVFALKRPAVVPSQYLSTADTLSSCEYARPDNVFRHLLLNLRAVLLHPIRYFSALRPFIREGREMAPRDFAQLLYHFAWGVGLAAAVRRRRIAHLHCHFRSACNAGLAANLYSRTSFSFTAHASGDLFVKPVLLPTKVRQAHMVVPVCDYSRRYVDSVTDFAHSEKLHRVYNGIDLEESSRLAGSAVDRAADAERSPPVLRLLSVGSLVGVKGHSTLIEVCALLHREGFPLQCTIVGSGPQRTVLERRIREAELTEIVGLAGLLPIGDVYRAMRQADVFVLLSEIGVNGYRDGFPTVILEAMAMGLPVVSTWISGIPEMVEDEVTGILVPERDPPAASVAIRRLLQDPPLRRRMGLAGRERVGRLFAINQSADQLAQLLSNALSAPREVT